MYSSWLSEILQTIEKISNEDFVWTLLFLFPLLSVVLSLRDAPKSILSKPKWGAQEVVRRGMAPFGPP